MTTVTPATVSFGGLEVVAFETRNAKEAARLISRHGGVPLIAPSVKEVPLEENAAAFEFAEKLLAGHFHAVVFMTGSGVVSLCETLETHYPRSRIISALSRTLRVARGPKAVRALKELSLSAEVRAPEPYTWREVLLELDRLPRDFWRESPQIAVQEYGAVNAEFLRELAGRGANVFRVPVYRWTLPDDLGPLEKALDAIVRGRARVVVFTNAVQVEHVLEMASRVGMLEPFEDALKRCLVCSVGPSCSEALRSHRIAVGLEPEHHKMGILIHEAARRAPELLYDNDRSPRIEVPRQRPTAGGELPRWFQSRFMRACRKESVDATPVWLMRQAGRYLKEYRDLRAHTPFLELCKNPDRVAEITVNAAERIGADAAIIFADLLLIAEPMGFRLEYAQAGGPRVAPALHTAAEVDRLPEVEELPAYVFEAIRRARKSLDPGKPLIGFAGAPFTLASYLIEGGSSRTFRHTKMLMFNDPGAWRALMEYLARHLARYIQGQIEAGVQAVQVFDSWVGCLSPADYREFVLPHSQRLFRTLDSDVPLIHFGTGTGQILEAMREAGGNIIGLDHRVDLDEAWRRLGPEVGVQGNLDPVVLCAGLPYIRQRVVSILQQAGGRPGHIFNLGHGVLPETPEEHVIELVKIVHERSSQNSGNRPAPHP
ncbi:MAG: uroporphyrinogen decarboxylase [Terriglobia bacterium]